MKFYLNLPEAFQNVLQHASICTLCPRGEDFRDRVILLYGSKTVDKKEILRTVSNTGIYCSGDKVGTVYLV
jgi:predicted transport protein